MTDERAMLAQRSAEAGARAVLKRPLTDTEFFLVQISVRGALADHWYTEKYGCKPEQNTTGTEVSQ